MADRTVAVTLKAQVLDFVRGMDAAGQATIRAKKAMQDTGQATEKLSKEQQKAAVAAKRAAAEAEAAAQKQRAAAHEVGLAFTVVGATAAAGLFLAVKASSEFGAKMAQLQSLSHASGDEMKQLSDAAMSAGTAFGFSATQVADAEIELTKAGIGVKDQLGGALTGALTLAAAGQIDVAQATEITTVAMTQFGLKAAEVPHVADLLAAGADKALGSVGDLGAALSQGGLQAHNMGLTIDETVGTLSAFANAGIIGAEAGTQLRSMFIQIEKPSTKAKKVMDEYGISMYNAQGKFIGMTALAGELSSKLGKLTQEQKNTALATIFGSYAINGASVVMGLGAKKMQDWITAVNDSGFASAQAAGKMNSLQGDVQKLAAAFQTDLIKAGTSADGALRGVVQSLTGVITAFGGLPQWAQGGVVAITAVVAGVGLLGGAALLAIPKIVAFKAALSDLGVGVGRLGKMLSAGGLIVAGIADIGLAFTALGTRGTATADQVVTAAGRIRNAWKGANADFGSAGSNLTSGKGLKAALDELGNGDAFSASGAHKIFDALTFGIAHTSDVYKANEATFAAMGEQLGGLAKINYRAAASSFDTLVQRWHLGADEVKNLLNNMPAYRTELTALAVKYGVTATDANLLSIAEGKGAAAAKVLAGQHRDAAAAAAKQQSALAELNGVAGSTTVSVDDLKKALKDLSGGEIDSRAAARDLAQSFDDAAAAAKKNGRTLDINTQKGRDNAAALDNIAEKAAIAASKYLDAGGSADGAAKIMANGKKHFIDTARAMGDGATEAAALAKELFGIPTAAGPAAAKVTALSAAAKAWGKKFEAQLLANDVPAKDAHKRAMALAHEWQRQHPKATLDADNAKARAAAKQAAAAATVYAQKQYLATLLANGVPAGKAIKMAKDAAAAFGALDPKPILRADPNPAIAAARRAQFAIDSLHGKSVGLNVVYHQVGAPAGKNANQMKAAGGSIDGPGPKGVDSVPIIAAPGEHMLTAGEVDALGGQAGAYRLRAAIRSGAVPRYADGGAVPRYSTSAAAPTAGQSGGVFTGDLYLDSGEFLGKVRGEVNSGINRHEHAKRLRVPR